MLQTILNELEIAQLRVLLGKHTSLFGKFDESHSRLIFLIATGLTMPVFKTAITKLAADIQLALDREKGEFNPAENPNYNGTRSAEEIEAAMDHHAHTGADSGMVEAAPFEDREIADLRLPDPGVEMQRVKNYIPHKADEIYLLGLSNFELGKLAARAEMMGEES